MTLCSEKAARPTNFAAMALALVVGAACTSSDGERSGDTATAAVASADTPDAHAPSVAGARATSTIADPDHRFIAWMLNHHAEVVYLAHQAAKHPDSLAIRAAARRLDQTHDAETAELRSLLRAEFGDTNPPAIRQEHVGMVTPFARLSGDSYANAFRGFLLAHHGEAVATVDSMLSRLTRPAVRTIAQRIRRERQRDIAALQPGAQR